MHVIPVWELHDLVSGTSLDFFLIRRKKYIQEATLYKRALGKPKITKSTKTKTKNKERN